MASASQISFRNLGRQSWASAPTPRGGTRGRHAGSSCPTGGCGEPPRLPWVAAHSGASAARVRRNGRESRQRSSPKGSAISGNPSVAFQATAPFTQGSLGDGGCGLPRRPCGPPRNDNGFLSFRGQCAHWTWESVLFTMDGDPGRRGRRPLRKTQSPPPSQPARSEASAPAWARDGRESTQEPSQKGAASATAGAALSEAESAERAAGQIRSLPDD